MGFFLSHWAIIYLCLTFTDIYYPCYIHTIGCIKFTELAVIIFTFISSVSVLNLKSEVNTKRCSTYSHKQTCMLWVNPTWQDEHPTSSEPWAQKHNHYIYTDWLLFYLLCPASIAVKDRATSCQWMTILHTQLMLPDENDVHTDTHLEGIRRQWSIPPISSLSVSWKRTLASHSAMFTTPTKGPWYTAPTLGRRVWCHWLVMQMVMLSLKSCNILF